MQMQKSKFNVGDVVEVKETLWPFVKTQLGRRANKKFRVEAIKDSMVQVTNLNIFHEEYWLSEVALDLVTIAIPEPTFTPVRPTEPSPALSASYGKSVRDMTDKEVNEYFQNNPRTDAVSIMKSGINAMTDRAAERDNETERSMSAAVAAFNALHGTNLTEELGWQFMVLLKMSRAKGGKFRLDDYIDGAAYNALAGEAAAKERQ